MESSYNLYRECVVARISIEQRPDGEHISLFCRPASAAAAGTAAAASRGKKRRKQPNQRRAAKQQLWRDKRSRRWDTATSQHQQQQRGATASREQQQQCSSHETPQQQLGLQNAATGSYAAAAAQPAVSQPTIQPIQQTTARVTRSSKKLRVVSPPEAAGGTSKRPRDSNNSTDRDIPQTDGADDSLYSPAESFSTPSDLPVDDADQPSPLPLDNNDEDNSLLHPSLRDSDLTVPPTVVRYRPAPVPPPMSRLTRHPQRVLCRFCSLKTHFTYYAQCEFCR